MKTTHSYIFAGLALLLSACGGSSSSATDAATTETAATATATGVEFPFLKAYTAMVKNGINTTFALNLIGENECAGKGSYVLTPATAGSVFYISPGNPVDALRSIQTFRFDFTSGPCIDQGHSNSQYYSAANGVPLGVNYEIGEYRVFSAQHIPQTVRIGDSGPFFNTDSHDSTTLQYTSQMSAASYAVTAGSTPNTAIFTITHKNHFYDDVEVYSLTSDGAIKPVSFFWGGIVSSLMMKFD
ncbi:MULTISPECIES: hypothetical protein [unclassified Undibacterium]|uniref:hypothetical protein n=1 Tax=unclassified Undibacterium TaxID=2630295 RepID=UPI002AC90DAB|nr:MULTISPECIES: hypothetical protein [unclassified Undibacterium]MEB0141014.1 hypothetical protein [Undibacterium sp. CCC2.1]MEB0171157.1 hypothetical protein [Undibacterium sp. CCC1.1]MEB0175202.1 hypothetical protein [Undibacterium sp. CCC3.4]MEB0214610.1 hypothetical protein [Undibacterium sp. 5I2]WPX42378.1 hypothetical protein RHM61_13345 [Undibacterium sp. CCC3.4]